MSDQHRVTLFVKFKIGDVVYLVTADEPVKGIIIGLNVRPEQTHYLVSWGDGNSNDHYAIELTSDKPV